MLNPLSLSCSPQTADVEQLMERMKELRESEEEISLSENRQRFAFAKQEAFSLPESEGNNSDLRLVSITLFI